MKCFFILLVLVFLFTLFQAPVVRADYITKLEQQINLIDTEYSTGSNTFDPTDNRLGLIKWDGSLYTGGTVYFEAIIACTACSGGNAQAEAVIYSSTGSEISQSSVSAADSNYLRVRSSPITSYLSDNSNYTVRLRLDAVSGTAYLKAARFIILQNASNLTATQSQVEVGGNGTFTNTAYALMPGGVKIFRYEPNSFDPLNSVYFESTLSADGAGITVYAALSSSSDCSTQVTGSQVTVTGVDWGLSRSGDIKANLASNTNYWVCVKTAIGTGAIANAKIIINQSGTEGLYKTQTFALYNNTAKFDSDSTYTGQEFHNQFDPAHFQADNITYYFEGSLSTTDGTGYARLTNSTDNTPLTNTEITVDTFGLVRTRTSGTVNAYLPATAKNLDLELKNSSGFTTGANNAWLIVNLQRYPDPAAAFSVASVNSGESHNGITTTVSTQVNTINFETLIPGTPDFAAHLLNASANGLTGYTVTTKLINYLQGNDSANNIDAFPAAWSSPEVWSTPNSTTANNNTGWLGANTSDARVPGWNGASAKFAGLNYNNDYVVMFSSGPDAGSTAYVTYALEVNHFQPPDGYTGTIRYSFLPTY